MPLTQKKLIPGIFLLMVLAAIAAPPLWWSEGNPPVIDPAAAQNNHGPANIGQARHIAKSALEALRPVLPDVTAQIEADLAPIVVLTVPDPKTPEWIAKQKAPLLIGQLKAIADPFYTRLHAAAPAWLEAERIANSTNNPNSIFPWTTETTDDQNKAIANIGQLKSVFSLRFDQLDADQDGLVDEWEILYFLNLRFDADADPDNDGLSNLQEMTMGSDPKAVGEDSDQDGMPDDWELANAGAFAIYPPVIKAEILSDDTASSPLILSNDTDAPAGFSISIADNTAQVYSHGDSLTGGIPFAWEDISATGTRLSAVSESDDESEEIPGGFGFDLFGQDSTSVFVCSNGFLTLGEPHTEFSNRTLPDPLAPPSLIAPFWDDLNPASGGDIYYQQFADRLIVQFQDVQPYTGSGTYTFQAVLYATGEIEFRYQSMTGATESCTVGLQDSSGLVGLEVASGVSYPATGIAIRFFHPDFFGIAPLSGTIPAHSASSVAGTFHSLSIPAGQHTAQITVSPDGEGNIPRSALARLTVLADEDSDGIPDAWEIQYGLEPGANDASGDPDRDGYTNLEEYQNNTDPLTSDNTADADNDGMWDRWETLNGLDPNLDDSAGHADSDGLTNLMEFQAGTKPGQDDSDSDGMPDDWEIAHSLNPLLDDSNQDADGDGLTNLGEYQNTTDPHTPNETTDLDDDGMLDTWEIAHGLDPAIDDSALNPDKDGLTNLQEFQFRTKPKDPDSDGDLLPDGWEVANQLDPNSPLGFHGKSGDPDQDGAINFLEWQYGTDPHNPDSDGDRTFDGEEIGAGGNPNNPGDGGQAPPPNTIMEVPFRVGDPSGSHSETWQMTITPKGPDDTRQPFKVVSPAYGEMANETRKLWKNNQYEITVHHLRTDPGFLLGNGGAPDFDWEAQIDGKPTITVLGDGETHVNGDRYFIVKEHWIVDNKDGLLGTVDQGFDTVDFTPGKKALMMPVDFKLRDDADVVNGWDSTEAEDWTSVGVGKTNSIVRLSILGATVDLGKYYELTPELSSAANLSLQSNIIAGQTSDFNITGTGATPTHGGEIVVKNKQNQEIAGTLKVHVLEQDTIPTSIFYVYDDRDLASRFSIALSSTAIIQALNEIFTDQANVTFSLHSSGTVDVEQIPHPFGSPQHPRLFGTGGSISKDSLNKLRELTDKLTPTPAKLSILVVKDIREARVGGGTIADPLSASIIIENTANKFIYGHEVGHAVRLASKMQGNMNSHDLGPWPKELIDQNKIGLMYEEALPSMSIWIRAKDWKASNVQADRLE